MTDRPTKDAETHKESDEIHLHQIDNDDEPIGGTLAGEIISYLADGVLHKLQCACRLTESCGSRAVRWGQQGKAVGQIAQHDDTLQRQQEDGRQGALAQLGCVRPSPANVGCIMVV